MSEASKFNNYFFLFFDHSSQIFRFQWVWPYFFTKWIVYLSNMIWWNFFPDFFRFPDFFPDFSGFSSNLQISSQNGSFTFHIWYNDFPFRKFIRFPDFSPDVSGFFSEFSSNCQASSQNTKWLNTHKSYDYFIFLLFRFPDFFRIFQHFHKIFKFIL